MLTYCENPIKLLKRSGSGHADVRILIWHTNQILTTPIAGLQENDPAELAAALAALDSEAAAFAAYLKENG